MDSSWKLDKANKFQFSGSYQEQRNNLEQLGPKGLRAQGSIGIDSHSPNPYSTQLDLVSEQSPTIEYHAISQSYGIRTKWVKQTIKKLTLRWWRKCQTVEMGSQKTCNNFYGL